MTVRKAGSGLCPVHKRDCCPEVVAYHPGTSIAEEWAKAANAQKAANDKEQERQLWQALMDSETDS